MSIKPNWQTRSAEQKKAAVLEVLRRPANESENKAIPRIAKKYNHRKLPDGKILRLSKTTLRRLYYAWKADPSDKVFALNYAKGSREPMDPWLVELLEFYAIESKCSVSDLSRRLKAKDPSFPFSRDGLFRHLPAESRNRIFTAAKLWRKAESLYQEWKKLTGGNEA
jgi:hypothetical protein